MAKVKKQKSPNKNVKEIIKKQNVKTNLKAKTKLNKNSDKKLKHEKLKKISEKTSQSEVPIIYDPSEIERTLFIGNVPSNTKKVQLSNLVSQFGEVKSVRFRTIDGRKIFKHKQRKEADSLNAYIVMGNVEAVEKALSLSGTEFKGRHIRVTKAKKLTDEFDSKRVIFVGNLKYSATDEKLYEIFSSCGELEYARTIRNEKGCKGIAYVCFKKPESVTLALELNNTLLDERPIRLERFSKNKLAKKKDETKQIEELSGKIVKKEKLKKKDETKQIEELSGKIIKKEKLKKKDETKQIEELPGKIVKKEKPQKNQKKLVKTPKTDKKTVDDKTSVSNKKSEYRGVQIKKQKKLKMKKKTNAMNILAKKIAPKSKSIKTK